MKILVIDFETTGLNHDGLDEAIEVGCALWDPFLKKTYDLFSSLILPESKPTIRTHIEGIVGLKQEEIYTFARPEHFVYGEIVRLCSHADSLLAHNAPFDKQFFEKGIKRNKKLYDENFHRVFDEALEKPWLDSRDFDWPNEVPNRKLQSLVAHYFPGAIQQHRALFDVLDTIRCCEKLDAEKVFLPQVEMVEVKAMVRFEQKEVAKQRGFRWDGVRRGWFKKVKIKDLSEGLFKDLPFDVVSV